MLMKKYGRLYKRVMGFDPTICAYCDQPREVLDHVPPISALESISIRGYAKKGGKFLLYPSCAKCNSMLGRVSLVSYYERLLHLEARYAKKIDKIELWTEEEIDEMGYAMRAFIKSNRQDLEELNNKVAAIHEKLLKIELGELTEEGVEINPSY